MAKDRDFSDCLDFRNQLITSSGYHQIYYLIQLASKSKETMSQITMSWSTYKGWKLHMLTQQICLT